MTEKPSPPPPASLIAPPDGGCYIRDPVTGELMPDPAFAPKPKPAPEPAPEAAPEPAKGAKK